MPSWYVDLGLASKPSYRPPRVDAEDLKTDGHGFHSFVRDDEQPRVREKAAVQAGRGAAPGCGPWRGGGGGSSRRRARGRQPVPLASPRQAGPSAPRGQKGRQRVHVRGSGHLVSPAAWCCGATPLCLREVGSVSTAHSTSPPLSKVT